MGGAIGSSRVWKSAVTLPILQSLLLADHVYQDKSTSKFVICGVFSRVYFNFVQPAQKEKTTEEGRLELIPPGASYQLIGSPFAYINLIELHAVQGMELRFVDLADNAVSMRIKFMIGAPDPLSAVEVAIPLPPLHVTHPGSYALELLCDEVLLGMHRVIALENRHE